MENRVTNADTRIWPVILSGGSGTRLWPLSRTALPKQLLALMGNTSMIAQTAARVADRSQFQPPLVVTGADHAEFTGEQLGGDVTVLIEPSARNTAPAIALAALAISAHDQQALILVMPSDHQIALPAQLRNAVLAASATARAGWLVTFGIRAATPETGYGYIRAGNTIDRNVRQATAFIEKPDRIRAQDFVADGGYFWNAGIFLFTASAMLAELADHAPDVLAAAQAAIAVGTPLSPDATAFAAAPSISIDHAVFERAEKIAVCPVDPGWSDIGSWDALHGLGAADTQGNVISGYTHSIDTQGCLLHAEGTILTTVGINNLNIIATPDAVLVTARGRSQDVKSLTVAMAGNPALDRPIVQHHTWGDEWLVHDGNGIRVRKILLGSGQSLIPNGDKLMLVSGTAILNGTPLGSGQLQPVGKIMTSSEVVLLVFG